MSDQANGAARVGIWEDIEHDPSFRKQREFGAIYIGVLINAIRCPSDPFSDMNMTPHEIADRVASDAEIIGIISYDNLHHAPKCRANHFHRTRVPTGPCNCGAEPRRAP